MADRRELKTILSGHLPATHWARLPGRRLFFVCGAERSPHAIEKPPWLIEHTRPNHMQHVACIADILERIAADDEQVRRLADLNGAVILLEIQRAGAVDRSDADCVGRRDSGAYERVQFAVGAKAWKIITRAEMVRAEGDGTAGFPKRLYSVLLGLIDLLEGVHRAMFALCRFVRGRSS